VNTDFAQDVCLENALDLYVPIARKLHSFAALQKSHPMTQPLYLPLILLLVITFFNYFDVSSIYIEQQIQTLALYRVGLD
jgi:hypothetical protein